jgi:hypothetical protein
VAAAFTVGHGGAAEGDDADTRKKKCTHVSLSSSRVVTCRRGAATGLRTAEREEGVAERVGEPCTDFLPQHSSSRTGRRATRVPRRPTSDRHGKRLVFRRFSEAVTRVSELGIRRIVNIGTRAAYPHRKG